MERKIVPDIVSGQMVATVAPDTSARQAASLMTERHIGAVMVTDTSGLIGIFSERDMLTRVVDKGLDPDSTLISEVMTANPQTIEPDASAMAALATMSEKGFRHLPVVDGDTIVGMVSIRDLYAAVNSQLEDDIKDRDAFMFGSGYGG